MFTFCLIFSYFEGVNSLFWPSFDITSGRCFRYSSHSAKIWRKSNSLSGNWTPVLRMRDTHRYTNTSFKSPSAIKDGDLWRNWLEVVTLSGQTAHIWPFLATGGGRQGDPERNQLRQRHDAISLLQTRHGAEYLHPCLGPLQRLVHQHGGGEQPARGNVPGKRRAPHQLHHPSPQNTTQMWWINVILVLNIMLKCYSISKLFKCVFKSKHTLLEQRLQVFQRAYLLYVLSTEIDFLK